jgi:predicted Zn finger-like uncharacterized protein
MIVPCPACERRFRLDEGRFRVGAAMRCARCGHTFRAAATVGAGEGAGPARAAAGIGAKSMGAAPGERPLALLADGGREVRGRLRPALERLGFRVETADEGTEAFKAAVTRKPQAIVASVHLGGLSGVAICEGVKGSPHLRGIRVALVGSELSADLFNRDTAMAYGADVFLDERMPDDEVRAILGALLPARASDGGGDLGEEGGSEENGSEDDPIEALDDPAPPGERTGPEAIRRLARLMLSDLRLYNPDRFAQALRDGRVLQVFHAELQRGRELVDERFPELASRQALLEKALEEGVAHAGAAPTGSGTRTD